MKAINKYLVLSLLTVSLLAGAENTRMYLAEKPGKWVLHNNLQRTGPVYDQYVKNVSIVADWFHQTVPLMATPKGFDLHATIFGIWDEDYVKRVCNYGLRCQLNFDFELFMNENGKEIQWTIEPPRWRLYINNTGSGHGPNFHFEGYNDSKDAPALKAPLDKATGELNDLFLVFPFEKEMAPGASLYGDGNLIVHDPDRPPFWIPVTVREVVTLKLAFYNIRNEDKQGLYPYLKSVADKLTAEELNAPAYDGGDDAILKVNGKKEGLQIMKFNKNYWDRSLPASTVQLITMHFLPADQFDMDEFNRNNGHPEYGQLVTNSIPLNELATLIAPNRATAVIKAVSQGGIDQSRMSAIGWGQETPVADNRTEEGRAKNRRVEIVKK